MGCHSFLKPLIDITAGCTSIADTIKPFFNMQVGGINPLTTPVGV